MGAADMEKELDKKHVLFLECVRQIGYMKTYFKISEEEVKQFIIEKQNKFKKIMESQMYKGNCTKRRLNFLCQKCI